MSDGLGSFLDGEREGQTDSSGQFMVELGAAGRWLASHTLREPALAVLKIVQGALRAGSNRLDFVLSTDVALVYLAWPNLKEIPIRPPGAYLADPAEYHLSLALWSWWSNAAERLEFQWLPGKPGGWVDLAPWMCEEWAEARPVMRAESQNTLAFRVTRKVSKTQVISERKLLRECCRFCPIPVDLQGTPVQPTHLSFPRGAGEKLLPEAFHLAELYVDGAKPGIAVLRDDLEGQRKNWIDTAQTLYREGSTGLTGLRWRYPVRVAGVVARHQYCDGVVCQGAAFLFPEVEAESRAILVHWGVVVGEVALNWAPGLTLVVDASDLPVSLDGLGIVQGEELLAALQIWRDRIIPWLRRFTQGMMPGLRRGQTFSWQTGREIKVALGLFSVSVVTGLATFFPLTFLGLPWLAYHHGSRRGALERLEKRRQELQAALSSEPT